MKVQYKMKRLLFEASQHMAHAVRTVLAELFGGEKCLCCGEDSGAVPVCGKCIDTYLMKAFSLGGGSEARCSVCGKPLVSELGKCMDCRQEPLLQHADGVFPLYQYRLWKKDLLFAWKIQNKRALSSVFAAAVTKALTMLSPLVKPVLVPVPPRPGKIRNRGWDQIDELCAFLAYRYGFEVMHLLERTTQQQQKKLDREQRLETKGKSYVLSASIGRWQQKCHLPEAVVLVDDVLTTGVTVESCAALLKDAGVVKVSVLTLFIVD